MDVLPAYLGHVWINYEFVHLYIYDMFYEGSEGKEGGKRDGKKSEEKG